MSKYTTEVRFICETLAGYDNSQEYGKVNEIIQNSWSKVFDFDFPIFDEDYRSVLCQKILKHYYTREIGFETVGLWKLKLETKMQEIMPYYNKLYKTELLNFNPLYDTDYSKTHEGSDTIDGSENIDHTGTIGDSGTHGGTVTDNGTHGGTVGDSGTHGGTVSDSGSKDGTIGDVYADDTSDTEWNVYSDTPQGALTNVQNETYLTDARKITRTGEKDSTNDRTYEEENSNTRTYNETQGNTRTYNETQGNIRTYNETQGNTRTFNESNETEKSYNNTNEYVEHIIGKTGGGSYAKMIEEYRSILLNIDIQVIDELKKLFMLVW